MSYGTALIISLISFVVLLPVTWIVILKLYKNHELFRKSKNVRIFVHTVVFLAYSIPGGIVTGCMASLCISLIEDVESILDLFLICLLVILVLLLHALLFCMSTMVFGVIELESYWKDKMNKRYITYLILSMIVVICWTIPIYMYNSNVETEFQTKVETVQQVELVEICGVSAESLVGQADGRSLDESQITEIILAESLEYCYINEEGKKESNTINKEDCMIYFKDDIEAAYLETRTYTKYRIKIDNNKDSDRKTNEGKYTRYIIYLPVETFNILYGTG